MDDHRFLPSARARWGEHLECVEAHDNGRYVGQVFAAGDYLVQQVETGRVVVHRRDEIDYSTSSRLRRRAQSNRLNDATLAIYCVGGRRRAFLRESHTRVARLANNVPVPSIMRPQLASHRAVTEARTVGAAVAAVLLLASCASHKLVTPDGSNRVVINTPESLSRYQDLVARDDAIKLEKSELQRKLDALTTEVETLKAQIGSGQKRVVPDISAPGHSTATPAPQTSRSRDGNGALAAAGPAGEAIAVETDRVLFRVNYSFGKTQFAASEAFGEPLVRAAQAAQTVIIRGRTDSDVIDEVETRVALVRALRARDYLVSKGVDPAKIRLWYRAAGGFIADNTTTAGRALNRRVEIEARGLDTSAFAPRVADHRLSSNQ